MKNLAPFLMAASAGIILLLGLIHLALTFRGTKLHPRDTAVQAEMRNVTLVLTRDTTIWRAWIGFNASHSLGLILFGLVYGFLALAHWTFLFQSPFLPVVGLIVLAGYVFLAKAYWFSVPFWGVTLSTVLYVSTLVIAWA